ncbi:hypothetical protein [Actinomadura sp. 9N407]|uniref:hypothetical protein n=1 Tax=Actinomadura sp. 9N407 TaxID=3375154 RepID=UPI0037A5388B
MKRSVSWVVGGVFAVSAALPAANAIAAYSEVKHKASAYTTGKTSHRIAYAKDWGDDGRAVAAKYYRKSSPGKQRTLWNKSGPGRTAQSGKGSKVIKIRACVQVRPGPDKCGNWSAN